MDGKNWDDYTDFELNCKVASYCGLKMPLMLYDNDKPAVNVVGGTKDYCNNPADAWPIIVENEIALIPEYFAEMEWFAGVTCKDDGSQYETYWSDKNSLRAAIIVFLMMKEAEQ